MWPVFPPSQVLPIVLAMLACVAFSIFVAQPEWGRARAARVLAAAVVGWFALGFLVWAFGPPDRGAGIVYSGILVLAPCAFVTPVAAGMNRLAMCLAARSASTSTSTREKRVTRRALLHSATAAIPAVAALPGAMGLASARRGPAMPVIRLHFPDLHPDLRGLKILHLSDLHLGSYMQLDDLERALVMAKKVHRPDLIVLTGDLADDPSLIPAALRLVTAANARYGAIASLGNHEYLNGIEITRPHYETSPVPLLVGNGRAVRIGDATLFIGGSDDPVHMGGDIAWMVSGSIASSMNDAPEGADFKLLLCHRPEGHGPATDVGYDLTLSGHTHGGQIGLLGRSIFETLKPGIGWWGSYVKTKKDGRPSRLYTTSGFGHWFPFRFGCPTEMPIVVLEGATERGRIRPA
jgi:predicted MPP superfamily phosphohydrolase